MATYVSLFRGINVGGNHQVKMDALKALHESLGLQGVTPYIQSGNVVFTSDERDGAVLQQRIEQAFEQTFGFQSAVMLRSAAELEAMLASNPFQGQPEKAPQWIVVLFLAAAPAAGAWEALLQAHSGPEQLVLIGQEVHLYYAEGIGRSKLTGSVIEKKLKTLGTARNWNTVMQLHKLMQR